MSTLTAPRRYSTALASSSHSPNGGGAVSVDMGTAGKAVEQLKLGGGVGDYVVRVFARNRTEVTRRYHELVRGLDPLSDEFEQARRTLDGLEQYLLQLWRES